MTINIDYKSAVIILLAICVLFLGAFYYRNFEMKADDERERATVELLQRLPLSPQVIKIFRDLGYGLPIRIPKPQIALPDTTEAID